MTKTPAGKDEIVIQGDVQDQVISLICATWFDKIQPQDVTIVEDKKAKKKNQQAAAAFGGGNDDDSD